ncbi:MAG: terminase small subunit [Candidatus Nezhaarchaeales archaeon]
MMEFFVVEYPKDFNGTQAAIRAGYSKKTAKQQATRLLSKVYIQEAIGNALGERIEKTKIDAAWVLKRAQLINDRCTQVVPVMEKVDGEWKDTGEFKFDSSGANKSLEIIGKHVDVQAFLEKSRHELTGKDGEPLVELSDIERATRFNALLDSARERRDGHSSDKG